jgi:hypothetical protein
MMSPGPVNWTLVIAAFIGCYTIGIVILAAGLQWEKVRPHLPGAVANLIIAGANSAWIWFFALVSFAFGPTLVVAVSMRRTSATQLGSGVDFAQWPWLVFLVVAIVVVAIVIVLLASRRRSHLASLASLASLTSDPPVVTVEKAPSLADLPKQARLDLLQLFAFAVTQTTVVMFNDLIELANRPEAAESEQDCAPQKGKTWYVDYVRQELGARTQRQSDFDVILRLAEIEAEREIEAIQPDQRQGDPLILRRRAIKRLKYERAIRFLKNEKRLAEESLVSQRTQLISQFDRWQKSLGRWSQVRNSLKYGAPK